MGGVDFQNEPLDVMVAVGATGPHTSRIWIRADRAGLYRVIWGREDGRDGHDGTTFEIRPGNEQDNTHVVDLPPAGAAALHPRTAYQFRVCREPGGDEIGAGRFETAPAGPGDAPDRFAIALMSCHQPFLEDGTVDPRSLAMLRAARAAMHAHACKLLFTVGDQMYVDVPRSLSLFDDEVFRRLGVPGRPRLLACRSDEVRGLYQRRYRYFFSSDEWRRLHATYPCYPILDDHEIVDNWGSVPEHGNPEWQTVWQGARLAYGDYQASRVLSEPAARDHFGYDVVYGPIAAYVVDLRSHRSADGGGLLSEGQVADVERFLARHTDKQVVFLVLSVPAVHLPRWASRMAATMVHGVEDFSDRWSAPAHVADRDRLLMLLHAHQRRVPTQPVVLLSGDIHVACVHQVAWNDGTSPLYQVVSSPISHRRSRFESLAATLSIQTKWQIRLGEGRLGARFRRLPSAAPAGRNPYGDLNLGIIDITRVADQASEIRFLLYGQQDGEPVCVYESEPVIARVAPHGESGQA